MKKIPSEIKDKGSRKMRRNFSTSSEADRSAESVNPTESVSRLPVLSGQERMATIIERETVEEMLRLPQTGDSENQPAAGN